MKRSELKEIIRQEVLNEVKPKANKNGEIDIDKLFDYIEDAQTAVKNITFYAKNNLNASKHKKTFMSVLTHLKSAEKQLYTFAERHGVVLLDK